MITGLNHVNLRAPAPLLEQLRAFYRDVLGLQEGERPAFASRGYWLYAGGVAVMHLSVQRDDETPRAASDVPGVFDHFALTASDPSALAQRLQAHGVAFEVSRSDLTRQHQFFFNDPAGNGVELNFPFED